MACPLNPDYAEGYLALISKLAETFAYDLDR